MNGALADEAVEAGSVLREAIAGAGGVNLLRRAVADPAARTEVAGLFGAFGLWELAPLEDPLELEVAALACQAAGYYAAPYPIVERLARRAGDATALIARTSPRVASHIDLPLEWSALDLRGTAYRVSASGEPAATPLAPFVGPVSAEPTSDRDPAGAALLVTLQSWWLLGLLEHALADTVRYTREREQFGRAIIKFQGVSFLLADMTVEVEALTELAKYTLWSMASDAPSSLVDGLALRVAALSAADVVMRGAHQLHGAMGFTDEVDVSWMSRASQVPRRLPEGRHRSEGLLLELIERDGWRDFGTVGGLVSRS